MLIVLFYTAGLFIAPLTLEPETIGPLEGQANHYTFSDEWRELPLYHRIIYSFSDFNRHQRYDRSYTINDNQMPVCARCTGIFIGLTMGLALMVFITPRFDWKDTLLQIVPGDFSRSTSRKKLLILIWVGTLTVLPILLDGGIQLVTEYESNNAMRMVTGLIFGTALAVFLMGLLLSSTADWGENNKYGTSHPSRTEDLQWRNGKVSQKGKQPVEDEDSTEKRRSTRLDQISIPR